MTYGNEPRRKRSTGSSRRDETDEADNWLAGLRGGRSDEPDPFSSQADPFDEPSRGPASTLRSTEPPTRPFQPPPGRGAPPTYDDSSPIAESNGASRSFSGVPGGQFPAQSPPVDDESSSRNTGRRRARDEDESPSRSRRPGGSMGPHDYEEAFGAPPGYPPPGPPSGYAAPPPSGFAGFSGPPPGGRRAAREDEPPAYGRRIGEEHSVYDVPAYPASGRRARPDDESPSGGRRARPEDESPSGGRRARPEDESPSGGRRAWPEDDRGAAPQPRAADYESPSGRVGRRRARDDDGAPEGRFNGFGGGPEAAAGPGFGGPDGTAGPSFNGFGGPPEPPRSFAASTSYDHGPTLEPIIKPLTGPLPPPDEPPPLVPIFPGLGQPAPVRDEPASSREDARWARPMRADEPPVREVPRDFEPRSGDVRAVPRDFEPRSGDVRAVPRDFEPRSGDVRAAPRDFESRTGDPRTADRRYDDRAGYPADAPATQTWRPAAASASASMSAAASASASAEAPPYPPAPANGARRPDGFYGPGGDYTGEFTSGGSRRPLRPPGGPGTLERPTGPAGRGPRSTSPTIDPVKVGPEQHRPHKWIAVISVIGVLALVAVCGLGTWFMINDERKGPAGTQTGASSSPASRDISSRKADPAPLTEAEVFPNTSIQAAPNEAPYIVLSTAVAPDCSTGATDDLAKLLATAGCNQVVRGTMKSPTGDYLVTAGLFNLNDQKAASDAFNAVKAIVDGQKGRFVGMSAGTGTGTDAITRAPTQLSWNYRGHFIAYAVIARTDGQAFAAADPYPNQITFDIVETYLENGIIGARATVPPKPSAAASMLPPSPGKS